MLRRFSWMFALVGGLAPLAAHAGCDTYVRRGSTATGSSLVKAFDSLAGCDLELAKEEYQTFMVRASDLDTLVPLTLTAIDRGVDHAVWAAMERVPYEYRTPLAEAVGEVCGDHPRVEEFVQGAYVALKGTEFVAWMPTLASCPAESLRAWVRTSIQDPPSSPYNDKYNALLTALTDFDAAAALPLLEVAAITIGTRGAGPFNNVIDQMNRAVQPRRFGAEVSAEDKAALEDTLSRVGMKVAPEQARMVADRLYTAGAEAKAASLMPAVYPDRVQAGGEFLWGVAAIEACDKDAVVHWAGYLSAPVKWSYMEVVQGPIRNTKAKLKCEEKEPWVVRVTPEPMKNRDQVASWVLDLEGEWVANGYEVKLREEKKVSW